MITEIVKLIAQFDDQASPDIKKLNGVTSSFLSGIAEGALKAGAAFLSVKAVFDGFTAAIARADALDDLSEKTGIAVTKLGELGYAARINGGASVESLANGFKFLGKAMVKSDEESSKQAEAFKELGVSAETADGKLRDTAEVFGDIADKFKDLPNGAEKSTLAMKLFGSAGQDLIPVLNKGREGIAALKAEAEQFGVIIPPEAAEQAGILGDNIERAQSVFEGFFNILSAAVVPILNTLIEAFIESAKEGGILRDILNGVAAVFTGVVVPAVKVVASVFNGFMAVLKLVGKTIGGVAAAVIALLSGDFAGAKAAVTGLGEDFQKTAADVAAFQAKLFDTSTAAGTAGKAASTFSTSLNKTAKAAKEAKSELQGMYDTLRIANASFGKDESQKQLLEAELKYQKDLLTIGKARADVLLSQVKVQIELNKVQRENAEIQERVKAANASLDMEQQNLAIAKAEAEAAGKTADERERIVQAVRDQYALAKLLDGLSVSEAEKVEERFFQMTRERDELKKVQADAKITNEIVDGSRQAIQDDVTRHIQAAARLLEAGKITVDDYNRYQMAQMDRLKEYTKKTLTETEQFYADAAKGMQDDLQTFFFDFMQGKLTNLGDMFKQTIDKMVAQALAAKLSKALFGDGAASGESGGLFGGILSGLGGLFGGKRAAGGPVQAGKAYLVGERGPEPFIPSTSGTILPNSSLSGGSSNISVSITAIDSKDFMSKMSEVKREVASLVNYTNRNYRMQGA